MQVTVKLGAPLSAVIGQNKVALTLQDGATVDDLLKELRRLYPDFDDGLKGKRLPVTRNHPVYRLLVNSGLVQWEDTAATSLGDGDLVYLFLPYGGG